MRRRAAVSLAIFSGFLACAALPLAGNQMRYSTWVVYWDQERGLKELDRSAQTLEEVAVFAAHFRDDGQIAAANDWVTQSAFDRMKIAGRLRVMLTVVNDVVAPGGNRLKDAYAVHSVLATAAGRAQHTRELLALSQGLDGVEIDYEKMAPADRENFSLFIEGLAAALHEKAQKLSVVVEPKFGLDGPIDLARVGKAADYVKIMAYFLHHPQSKPGPLAPPDWVVGLGREALKSVPKEKLWVAVSAAGFDWPERGPAKRIEYGEAVALAAGKKLKMGRDLKSSTLNFRYKEGDVVREVWVEDDESLRQKVRHLADAGIGQVAIWYLGSGDPDFWKRLDN